MKNGSGITPASNASPELPLELKRGDVWTLRHAWREEQSLAEGRAGEVHPSSGVERYKLLDTLREIERSEADAVFRDRTWSDLAATITQVATRNQHPHESTSPVSSQRYFWRWAVGVAALMVAGLGGWMLNGALEGRGVSEHYSIYTTAAGEQATVKLPDGTTAILNVGTRLRVPSNFLTHGQRTVELSGEAMFTVEHQSGAPFTVMAGPGTIRVLGTKFAVRRYDGDTAVSVAVQQGRVNVNSVVVSANEQTTVTEQGVSRLTNAEERNFAFERGVLRLATTKFVHAIPEFNRWFDVEIRLADQSVGAITVGGDFEKGSPSELADQLSFGFDVKVVREGRVLTLYPKGERR